MINKSITLSNSSKIQ